jgi:hypothetical protein
MPRFSSEENRHRRMDTDTEVAEQEARARVAAQRRFDLDTFYRAFLDDEPSEETSFDRVREGRSAT